MTSKLIILFYSPVFTELSVSVTVTERHRRHEWTAQLETPAYPITIKKRIISQAFLNLLVLSRF